MANLFLKVLVFLVAILAIGLAFNHIHPWVGVVAAMVAVYFFLQYLDKKSK